MRCESCIFRHQLDDSGFLDELGAPRPIFRCKIAPDFRVVGSQYCLYLLDTTRFYEDSARFSTDFMQLSMIEKVKESLEALESVVCLLPFTAEELETLKVILHTDIHKTGDRVRAKNYLFNRVVACKPPSQLRVTQAECAVLSDLVRMTPNLVLLAKLRSAMA